MLPLKILVQNGSPLSMLSEGSQPYAYYKNSAHVSDSGMNEMQPTHVYTLQQEPECSSHCGMDGNLRGSPGTWPGRAFWLGIASRQLSRGWPPCSLHGLKQRIYPLHFWRSEVWNEFYMTQVKVWAGPAPPKAPGENPFLSSSRCWRLLAFLASRPHRPSLCLCPHITFPSL